MISVSGLIIIVNASPIPAAASSYIVSLPVWGICVLGQVRHCLFYYFHSPTHDQFHHTSCGRRRGAWSTGHTHTHIHNGASAIEAPSKEGRGGLF